MSKMMGPGQKPGGNPGMKRRGSRNPGKTLKRLLGYIWKYYKMEFVIVLIAIVIKMCIRDRVLPAPVAPTKATF